MRLVLCPFCRRLRGTVNGPTKDQRQVRTHHRWVPALHKRVKEPVCSGSGRIVGPDGLIEF